MSKLKIVLLSETLSLFQGNVFFVFVPSKHGNEVCVMTYIPSPSHFLTTTTTTNFINKQIILQKHCPKLARLFEAGQCVHIMKNKANYGKFTDSRLYNTEERIKQINFKNRN